VTLPRDEVVLKQYSSSFRNWKRILGRKWKESAGEWRKLLLEQLDNSFSSAYIIKMVK
jgi:hypothetical protein